MRTGQPDSCSQASHTKLLGSGSLAPPGGGQGMAFTTPLFFLHTSFPGAVCSLGAVGGRVGDWLEADSLLGQILFCSVAGVLGGSTTGSSVSRSQGLACGSSGMCLEMLPVEFYYKAVSSEYVGQDPGAHHQCITCLHCLLSFYPLSGSCPFSLSLSLGLALLSLLLFSAM